MDDFEYQLRAEKEYGEGSLSTEDSKARTYVDANDGVVYEWDADRGGWFPKIDEEFLASYQAGYGVSEPDSDAATVTQPTSAKDTTAAALTREEESLNEDGRKDHTATSVGSEKDLGRKRKVSEEGGWFDIDSDHNSNVYVSGLPLDITVEEFAELMGKCGIIMEDEKGEPKVKLYEDVNGELKGDGLCCYLKIESVELAMQLLDQSTHREHTITVQQAKFQMKGEYNPALKKKKKTKKNKKKGGQEKLLDWRERNVEGPKRLKSERVVIFKHLFDPKEFEDDPMAINEIRDDLRQECETFGVVKKILIFDRHPDGVGSVAFQDFVSADQCVQKLHGRWFGGQRLEVGHWDGVTNYQVEETDQEREQRLSKWEEFLNERNSGEGKITVVERGAGEREKQGVQDEEPKT